MKKRLFIYLILSVIFVALFEFYLFYLLPNDMNFGIFLSSVYNSISNPQSDKLIRINLYNKSFTMIEKGQLVKFDKISAAGNPKTSPTPQGNFKIINKAKKVMSYTGLIMPLSLRFKGPYYMHGIPLTKSGQPYNSTYSAGYIRIGPGLDQELYDWADIGSGIQIYNTSLVKSQEHYTVYYLTLDRQRQPISSPQEFESRGFKWDKIAIIPQVELDAIPLAVK